MKKVYLVLSSMLVAGVTFGQYATPKGGLSPFSTPAPAEKVAKPTVEHNAVVDRGSAFWMEDFSNGLSGMGANGAWSVAGTNGNIWKHNFTGPSGCFSANTPTPATTTAANGFMLFDADSSNCTDPSGPTFTQDARDGELISPVIDCSGQTTVNVVFEQSLRYCCTQTLELMLGVSTDGGTTWTEFDALGGLAVNAQSPNPDVVNINISSVAAGSANVQLRFRWGGGISHYYWAVDDVMLMPSPANEVALLSGMFKSENFAGAGHVPYTMVPDEQAQNFYVEGTVSNQGASAEDITITGEVWDGGTTVATLTGSMGAVTTAPAGTHSDTTNFWNSGTSVGTTYNVVSNFTYANIANDNDITNNGDTLPCAVTDFIYGRDLDVYSGSGLWNGDGNGYVLGPVYTMVTTQTLMAVEVALTPSTDAGAFLYAQVYEIDPATGDFVLVYDGSGTTGEIELQASDISTTGNMVIVTLPVINGLSMNAGSEYIVAIGHYGGTENIVVMNGGIIAPDQTVFLLDATDQTWYYTTSTPIIRANFDSGVGIEEESAGITLGQNMPNPFNGTTQVNFSLENSSDVTFVVTDVTGKVVKRMNQGTLSSGEHTITMDASEFANGVYYYTLTAGEFQKTKRMIVTK